MKAINATIVTALLAASADAATLREKQPGSFRRASRNTLSNAPSIPNGRNKSKNWGGKYQAGDLVTSSSAVIFPPSHITGSKKGVTYAGSQWVGIDGLSNWTDAFLSAGVNWVTLNNKTTYSAFYQWYPGPQYSFPNFTLNTHGFDSGFLVEVDAFSATSGSFTIHNGETADATTVNVSDQPSICRQTGEWVIQDPELNGKLAPFTAQWRGGGLFSGAGTSGGNDDILSVNLVKNGRTIIKCAAAEEDSGLQVVC